MTETQTAARYAALDALIASAGSTIFAVEFFKKDGTKRTMQVQLPAIKKLLVGEAASDSAKQAIATNKANNPHLRAVYDIAINAIRSINLDTVVAVTVRGTRHEFAVA